MTNIVDASCRALRRITCLNSASVPAGVTSIALTDVGVIKISDSLDPILSSAAGVPSGFKFIAGSVGSATYDLTVYGAMRIGGPINHADGPWLWVPLYKGSVAATLQYAGYESDGYMETTDYLAVTHTAASNGAADVVTTNYGAAAGPSHVVVPSRGCPYLLFVANGADKFALVAGQS